MHWGSLAVLATLGLGGDQPAEEQGVPCMVRGDFGFGVLDEPNCSDLFGSERIRGTWLVGNEESSFLPEGSVPSDVRVVSDASRESEIWLHVGWPEQLELLRNVPEPEGTGDTAAYQIEFVGRRARHVGEYGHMGASKHLIVLDELVAIHPVRRVRTRIEFDDLSCWIDECDEAIARREGRMPN